MLANAIISTLANIEVLTGIAVIQLLVLYFDALTRACGACGELAFRVAVTGWSIRGSRFARGIVLGVCLL